MTEREATERLQKIRQFYLDTIKDDTAVEAVDMAISALEKQEADGWIPVVENPKKPKYQFDTYLVYTKYGRYGVADFFADGGWIGYDIDGDPLDGGEITAWRPLPEPYTEEES